MPPPKYLQSNYFGAMDKPSYFLTLDQQAPLETIIPEKARNYGLDSGLTSHELGTTLNPMQNQLQALQAKIREGASKVEFEFSGKGKGNSQASTPESYGEEEREMMRRIAQLNDVKSSTHATFNVSGLAGFGQRGFDKRAQQENIQEVQRAIDFAKDATTGGAIVVHTGEWERPISTYYGEEGQREQAGFSMYEGEDDKAALMVVDERTGEIISGISKDRTIMVPRWLTAKDFREEFGRDVTGQGETINGQPTTINDDDYVDMFGKKIDASEPEQLFRRVPLYNEVDGDVKFKTDELTWEQLEERKNAYNEKYAEKVGRELSTEEYFAQMSIDNQILQSKGSSLYHLQRYKAEKDDFDKLLKAKKLYDQIEADLPEDQKWQLVQEQAGLESMGSQGLAKLVPTQSKTIPQIIDERLKELELSMRYTHTASSSGDVQAAEALERRKHLKTIEQYGLEQTGKALAKLAEEAMDKTQAARKMRDPEEKFDDLYIAPENWHPGSYGSHPEELLNIVKKGREEFVERMKNNRGMNEKQAEQLAKKHIKTTFDIGHLNMWRSMMKREDGEDEEAFQQRFDNWVFTHLDKLAEEEAIGHLHLTDNYGYNDEHLSLGQGNAPVKKFVEWAQKKGYTDFIIEAGSFNAQTIMHDGWSYLGAAPSRKMNIPGGTFRDQRMAHAGFYQSPNFLHRGYIPINDFSLWSDVPLE
ncbi:MAG: sugar phosphate isomerase/epimerase family protein [Candidatus Woesearchaeota archaeon]